MSHAGTSSMQVPGYSNPWLAGMPNGAYSDGDYAPNQSPQQVIGIPFVSGDHISFTVSGGIAYGPARPLAPPDGGENAGNHRAGADNGISDITAPDECLLGVFLGPDQPNLTAAPPSLDFSTAESINFTTSSPLLKQVFFIGDGRTSNTNVQTFIVPEGATRLYLGGMDGFGWNNNIGNFTVQISSGQTSQTNSLSIGFYAGLTVTGTIGETYRVEYSNDLTNWNSLATIILPESPHFMIDTTTEVLERRFYRLIQADE